MLYDILVCFFVLLLLSCSCLLLVFCFICVFFFFKQKTAYEMRISDWSSDVCSSDLAPGRSPLSPLAKPRPEGGGAARGGTPCLSGKHLQRSVAHPAARRADLRHPGRGGGTAGAAPSAAGEYPLFP